MSKTIGRLILSGLIALAMMGSISAIAGDTLQRVIDFKVLRVGMSGNQPPMTMISRDGGIIGFDVDLAAALAMAMKVKLEIEAMPFSELMEALEKNKIDMILSNLSITPQRTEQVSFVGPYMMSGISILTGNSALSKASSVEEFNRQGLKLLAVENSTQASFVKSMAPDATLIDVPNYNKGVAMLIAGQADAMVADMTQSVLATLRNPDAGLTTLDKPLIVEPIGIAVGKDDTQFYNLVDNYLRAYEKTGVLTQLRKKWFEDSAWIASLP
ncbi:MAG: transporter substrate-binding domain-containing protein [Halioglobus sp.]|nr:transporter substrate-binding domain-containing protein [Halioglobus sp.]